jgi:hypothetical protein
MWIKKDDIGLWLWIPDNYVFYESLAFFTIHNNFLDENKQIQIDNNIKSIATIVIYENNTNDELIDIFMEYIVKHLSIIGIFSFKKNRFSKPYTGAFELFEQIVNEKINNFKFKMEWSILISQYIGINGRYIDRAFAHNIGIKSITTPDLYFKRSDISIEWYYPANVLTERKKNKLFKFTGEPLFADFLFSKHINIVIITGPPHSGKTILGRRIAKYIGNCIICKNELPNVSGKSLVHISRSPTIYNKQKLFDWILSYNNNSPNLVWIEMDISRQLVEFLRHLRVQISKQTCPELTTYEEIKEYYKLVEKIEDNKIPSAITYIKFPLILKKIPELYYIF